MKSIHQMTPDELENIETLGLDDTFEFRCKACGKCCKNRTDIILTPFDVFRIADYFGRTPKEIIARYCEVYEGAQSHLPVVHVVPVLPDNHCPFLRDRKCSVHEKKPVLCRVYPLARVNMGVLNEDDSSKVETKRGYYFNGSSCKHEPQTLTVREWIADVASEEAEQAGQLWGEVIVAVIPFIQPEKYKSDVLREQMFSVLFEGLYLSYDMDKPFVPQMRENKEKLTALLTKITAEI